MLRPGEVVLIPFPYTDLTTTKRRPVLVLRPSDAFGDFLAAAVTSQAGHGDAVTLRQTDFREGDLPKPSYVRTTKLYTLNERIVARRFGVLTPEAFVRTQTAICTALDCQR
jgi:mRNA interferase MazF